MSLLEALQAKKTGLKNVTVTEKPLTPPNNGSKNEGPVEFSKEEMEAIHDFHFMTNMDQWIEKIPKESTIPTLTLPLTPKQGAALYRRCKRVLPEYPLPDPDVLAMTDEEIEKEISGLVSSIDALVTQCNGQSAGCFIKLSCRSPKDVSASGDIAHRLYTKYHSELSNKTDLNLNVRALYEASLHSLKVHSAREGLDLLLQSKRIAFDLALDLKFVEKFSMAVIIRPWIHIPLVSEFRAFVFDNKLTAISQYYGQCYFDDLVRDKAVYEKRIQEFFATIQPNLSFLPKYVIDFAVLEDKVLILELNPFHPSTSACLFDWAKDADLLEKGPFDFRIHNKPPIITKKDVLPEWSSWMESNGVLLRDTE